MTEAIPAGPIDREPLALPIPTTTERSDMIAAVLREAGVELGAYDQRIVEWLATWEWSTVAVIASWVQRAHQDR